MITSYHCHTRWSDGEGEITDFVRRAEEIGLDEVGLSDHYVLTPDRRFMEWAMPVDALDEYVTAVRDASENASIDVRLGVEADFIPETADELREVLAEYQFDYVIGSVHFLDGFPIDGAGEYWARLTQVERDDIIRGYWVRVRQMAESGIYDFAGHLDLTKKFGYYPSVGVSDVVSDALDALARSGMAAELNTSGWHVPAGEEYPSPEIIRGCFERSIPMLVTADAHAPKNLTRSFDRAYALLREIGFRELSSFRDRRRLSHPF